MYQSSPVVAAQVEEEPVAADKIVKVATAIASLKRLVNVAVQTSAPAREITVETDKYQAVFTTEGARLISFELKDYKATAAKDSPPVQMYETGPLRYSTLRTTGSEGFALSEDALFESSAASLLRLITRTSWNFPSGMLQPTACSISSLLKCVVMSTSSIWHLNSKIPVRPLCAAPLILPWCSAGMIQ